jgi:DNA-binding beta-propeller fold protein YncE
MKNTRMAFAGATLLAIVATGGLRPSLFQAAVGAQGKANIKVPAFEYDATWPKPLPETWAIGPVVGVSVDARDHIWIVHRRSALITNERYTASAQKPPIALCCEPAPPILEFDQVGNLVSSWGGQGSGYEWPQSEHGIYVDQKDFVWTAGNGARDAQILKFTRQGKFVLQIGHQGKSTGNNDTVNVHGAADMKVDPAANEVYVADGYGNRRVIVFDADSGAFKRMWGAYGNRPEDADIGPYKPDAPPAQQFRTPHSVAIANDGLVYVCDRANDRVQVFKKDGAFVKEVFIAKGTILAGSANTVTFSRDPRQQYLYVLDGGDHRVWILLRDSLQVVGQFGRHGHWGGQLDVPHNMAVDSKGNLYIGETLEGRRVQRFLYKGLKAASPN